MQLSEGDNIHTTSIYARGRIKKSKLRKLFEGTQAVWNKFFKPGLKMTTPLISAAVPAKTKNPQSAQITNNSTKSLTGGKILSFTDMHGHRLRLKVM